MRLDDDQVAASLAAVARLVSRASKGEDTPESSGERSSGIC